MKTITPRHLTPLLATMVAKRLIGTEWDIPLFGQMSKQQLKKDLKKRELWEKKDRKYKVEFYRKGSSEMSSDMKEVEDMGIDSLEEMDDGSFTVFTEKAINVEQIQIMERLSFIDGIKRISRVEVR